MSTKKKKRLMLFRGEVKSALTSTALANLIQDHPEFIAREECVGISVVPAGEYEIVLLPCKELAKDKRTVLKEFDGQADKMALEICRLRGALESRSNTVATD